MSFTLSDIETLVNKRIETYSNEPSFFKAAYENEKKLTAEYNGRQLLEMLQNCDDAGAENVEIIWDKNDKTLTISNSGLPFSIEGIESLMLANSSPKKGKSFIGNKGLGFRSILNWANQINIFTNACEIKFSESIAKDVFENKLQISDEQRKDIKNQLGLVEAAVPFPILAIPAYDSTPRNHWATSIQIDYDDAYEKKIEEQLNHLCEEILLFLNHITSLKIIVNGCIVNEFFCVKTQYPNCVENCQQINIGSKTWQVFSSGEIILPEQFQDKKKQEKELYNLKIAFQENLSDNYGKFFNFFPTKQAINLPCLVHGTLEINNSRDYFIDSDKNDYIIKQFPALFTSCVNHIKEASVNWDAYRFLTPTNETTESKEIGTLYHQLKALKEILDLYPTVQSKYVCYADMIYYNDEISSYVQKNLKEQMPQMALSVLNKDLPIAPKRYEDDLFSKILENLYNILSVKERASLIFLLAEDGTAPVSSLLVDTSTKKISLEDICFTPPKRLKKDYEVPSYAKIRLLNSDLYNELIGLYSNNLDSKDRDRDLVRKIKSVVNIRPYDSAAILELILSKTQTELGLNPDNSECIIKEMVKCLFDNYDRPDSKQPKSEVISSKVTLLNEQGKPVSSTDLFLSKTYPTGKYTEEIFGSKYENKYLMSLDYWELDCEPEKAETFFQWLGVNAFVKFELVTLSNNWEEWDYFKVVSQLGKLKVPDGYSANRVYNTSQIRVKDFDALMTLSISQIILLCHFDEQIKVELEKRQIEIKWFYRKQWPSTYSSCSYLRYQFISSGRFCHVLVENGVKELDLLIEGEQVDYKYLAKIGLPSVDVKSILLKLGAKETINNLSPDQLYSILLNVQNTEVKGIQTIYKIVADALDSQQAKPIINSDLELYAKIDNKLELLSPREIYYSNNSVLPQKVLDTLPILNFPKRAGEDKAAKYFGINIIKKSNLRIDKKSLRFAGTLDDDFQSKFEELKPYLLLYRLHSNSLRREIITKDAIRQAVLSSKKCQIQLVTNCMYQYETNDITNLEDFNFISNDNKYYIAVPYLDSLNELLANSSFSDAFAEIMSILFEVNELKNDFRFLIRNDINDTRHLVNQDFSEEQVDFVKSELGISQIEYDYWKRIFNKKQLSFSETITTSLQLRTIIEQMLDAILPDYYSMVDFYNCSNKYTYNFLNWCVSTFELPIDVIYPQGLQDWHHERMINLRADYEDVFKLALWNRLNSNKDEQKQFLEKIDLYKRSHISEIVKYSCKYDLLPDYKSILFQWVKTNIGIELIEDKMNSFKEENFYLHLFKKFEVDAKQIENDKLTSLLFFTGNENEIEDFFKTKSPLDIQDQFIINESDIDVSEIELVDAELEKSSRSSTTNDSTSRKRKARKTHSDKSDESKKIKGKESELLVLKKFKELYGEGNVKWVSGYSDTVDRDDNLQRDIEYRNEDDIWVHVEVKTLSNNSFILTEPEKAHALQVADKYEFALVSEMKIFRIYKPFKFVNGESFELNKSFDATPKDYTIRFNLSKTDE